MAAVMAMTYLREAGVDLAGDVIVQSVVNEEHAGNGTLDLVRRGYRADAAIVLEPTNNRIAVSHPGGLYWEVTVPGIVRSPGARWDGERMDGVSAIEKLPGIIDALLAVERGYNAVANDDPMEAGRAPFALTIGTVSGGHYETATAGEATLRGGGYFSPVVGDVGDVMGRFRSAIRGANEADDFLRENPARLAFLHHDDSTRQSPQIPVAMHAGEVVGHILFSPVEVDDARFESSAVGLAPMAVTPAFQRGGIGSLLVHAGLEASRELGYAVVVVLGHPEFYPRFGFRPAHTLGLGCEYPVPPPVFMALELEPGALDGVEGRVAYHRAFGTLG